MKPFKEFRSTINELFDKPARWKENRSNNENEKTYTANIKGKSLLVKIKDTGIGGSSVISFNVDGDIDITGMGDEFTIFATVLDIIDDFINKEEPKRIAFSAFKKSGDGSTSRTKLYNRLIKRFADSRGYRSEAMDAGDLKVFKMTKK